MGGKSSKPVIGYWYKLLLHFGLWRGPIDALLEFRGGEKTAWAGVAGSGTVSVDALELWGGEEKEGGIQGDLEVMLGEEDQVPSDYLAEHLGPLQSAFRGRTTVLFKGGKYGAFNPYPKPASFLGCRLYRGWQDDVVWQPSTLAIALEAPTGDPPPNVVLAVDATGWEYQTLVHHANPGTTNLDEPAAGWSGPVQAPFGSGTYPAYNTEWPEATILWGRIDVTVLVGEEYSLRTRIENGGIIWINGEEIGSWNKPNTQETGSGWLTFAIPQDLVDTGALHVVIKGFDETSLHAATYFEVIIEGPAALSGTLAMNAAHVLYDSLTHDDMGGEPLEAINEDSFISAADRLYDEGFGLCTTHDPVTETVEAFRQRICTLIGGKLSQSRRDGQYYLVLIRDDYVLEDLPILTDDDILEYEEEPGDPLEAVNQVTVEWFDPIRKEKRSTMPMQSLGAIQALGGIVAEVGQYPEIPYEDLALRVAARDLAYKSVPHTRWRLTTNRIPWDWLQGQLFRLQAPRRGHADTVCMVGELDAGTPRSGSMRLVATQHLGALPSATSGGVVPPEDTSDPQTPVAASAERVLETPYVDLVERLGAADLAALASDAGFLLAMAKRPSAGLNYALWTAAGAEDFEQRASGDWCPTALVVEAADRYDTSFTLSGATDLEEVEVGQAALWDDEIVRVEAIDADALTLELARGCADTVPAAHAAGARIWFYQEGASTDAREYADGEVAHAKVLTRTATQVLDLADAADLTTTMDSRAARPYPPAKIRVDGVTPAAAGTVDETFTVSWVHRDRLLQADQLVDQEAASVGPETNASVTLRLVDDDTDTLILEREGLGGTSCDVLLADDYPNLRLELLAVRDGLASWQTQVTEPFPYLRGAEGDAFVISNPGEPGTTDGTDAVMALADLFAIASGVDTITASFDPPLTLTDGLEVRVRAAGANTLTNPTFNADGAGALTIFKLGGQALAAGDIYGAGHEIGLRYRLDPERWELVTPAPAAGGTASGESIELTFAQAGHGLSVGMPIYTTGSAWAAADKDSDASAAELVVSAVVDANNFKAIGHGKITLTTGQWDARTGDTGGLTAGEYYWLGSTAGALTKTQPSAGAQAVLKAWSTTVAYVLVGEFFDAAAASDSDSVTTVTAASVSPSQTSGTHVLLCDTGANGITLNLPTAVANSAKFIVKKLVAANTVTIDPASAQTIDGSPTATISIQYESRTLVSDGSNWHVV